MGTLSNKYPNSTSVEEALDKGVDAYSQSEENKTDISLLKENAEFTPRVIGRYNMPWFIEGQGNLSTVLTQLQKNIFSLSINGGGSAFTIDSEVCSIPFDIPVIRYNPSQSMSPYTSVAVMNVADGGGCLAGVVGFSNDIADGAPNVNIGGIPIGTSITSLTQANIIIYGELIEEETT